MDASGLLTLPPAWLESEQGHRMAIRGTCSLGRTTVNDVVLADDRVSRRHAIIHAQSQGEYWLVDLGSANGTYVNDRRVTQPNRLANGDRITIARHEFVFRSATPTIATARDRPSETIQDVRMSRCWLLLADIENSTQFIQRLAANDIPRVTGRWLAACKQLIDENRGAINKYLGDGFLAYWIDTEGIAAAVAGAVRALRDLQSQDQPRFRVVVHCGEVSIGGGPSLGEESLMGSHVNFAFRMEKLAGSLGACCLFSEAAHHALQSVLPTIEQGRHPVPGFGEEHAFYTLQ